MTARMNDRELDRLLDAWIDEGPTVVSEMVIDGALARIPTTVQRGGARRRLHPLAIRRWPTALRAAGIMFALVALVTATVALALVLAPDPAPDPAPTPTATPSASAPEPTPSDPPSAATGVTSLEVTGAIEVRGEWKFAADLPSTKYPGLIPYGFFESAGGPPGAYFVIFLDPGAAYPSVGPTNDRLFLRFGFPGNAPSGYLNSHESMAGECQITFRTFNETEVEGRFDCADVPSITNDLLISAAGEFSFDPREVVPEERRGEDCGC